MLDERQRRGPLSRHRVRPTLRALPTHEAYHARQDSPRAGDVRRRGDDRPHRSRTGSACSRKDAGSVSADLLSLRGRVVVVGAGVAGLLTALELAPRRVIVLSKAPLGAEGSTLWAQGGIAAAMADDDSPALHATDTIAAGDGLTDPGIAKQFARAAPQA